MTPEEKHDFLKTLSDAIDQVTKSPGRDQLLVEALLEFQPYRRLVSAAVRANISGIGYDGAKSYEKEDVFVISYAHLYAITNTILHAGISVGLAATEMGAKLP
jgi:hypothetical protein